MSISHGYGIETIYGHLAEFRAKPGEKVHRGQVIALMGNTGRSTGPHLHYQVEVNGKPVNPHNYILD
jgi:murein DD-endopeptidase MepM/ murein hydrolase activator NlpD